MMKFAHFTMVFAVFLSLLATFPVISDGQDSGDIGYTPYPASVYNNATIENVFEPGILRTPHDRISQPVPLTEYQLRDDTEPVAP